MLRLFVIAVDSKPVRAEEFLNTATVTIESHGTFTFNGQPVGNLADLATIVAANNRQKPQPALLLELNDNNEFNEIDAVMKLVRRYKFGQTFVDIRVTPPTAKR